MVAGSFFLGGLVDSASTLLFEQPTSVAHERNRTGSIFLNTEVRKMLLNDFIKTQPLSKKYSMCFFLKESFCPFSI